MLFFFLNVLFLSVFLRLVYGQMEFQAYFYNTILYIVNNNECVQYECVYLSY